MTAGVAATLDDGLAPTLSATWPALALGQSSTLRYQATVGDASEVNVGDVLTNAIVLTWTSLSGPSADERTGAGGINDYRAATTAPVTVTGPDVRVAKTDGETNVAPGDPLIYIITVTNDGNGTAPNVLLTDTIPANTTFQSASDGGTFAARSGDLADVRPGVAGQHDAHGHRRGRHPCSRGGHHLDQSDRCPRRRVGWPGSDAGQQQRLGRRHRRCRPGPGHHQG